MVDLKTYTDSDLVQMTVSGNHVAYGELVSRYKNMVFRVSYSVVSDHYVAEDIAQDTFVDGFMQLTRLTDPDKFAPWVYGIARRKSLHYITRRRFYSDIDEMAEILYSDTLSPEDAFIKKEKAAAVKAAIKRLTEKNRVVAVRYYFNNETIKEIAQNLSLPVGTVKSRLHEARAKLKGELEHMKESTFDLSPDFEKIVREKIYDIKKYYNDMGIDDGWKRLYSETESFISRQPDSDVKQSLLADLYYEKYLHFGSDEELKRKMLTSAESGRNGVVLLFLYIDNIITNHDYKEWIRIIDNEAIPKMDELNFKGGKGVLHFWRGTANIYLHNIEAAVDDFKITKELSPENDMNYALAYTALKIHDKLTMYADDPFIGFNVISESYQKKGSKVIFKAQPGFSCGNEIFWDKHKKKYINYNISRFDDIFFDTSMEAGKTYTSKNSLSSLCLIGFNDTINVDAGTFGSCMHLFYSCPGEYDADIWYAEGVGLVKVTFNLIGDLIEEYELSEYDIKGGEGYFPFCVGNRWRYINHDLPDYLYQCFENEVVWTDGEYANVSATNIVSFKKNYQTDSRLDSDIYIAQCSKACDEWKIDDAISLLQKAVKVNSSQNASVAAMGGIEYLRRMAEYHKKGYRFCPSSYNTSFLIQKDHCIHYDESGAYSFGPYRWGSRFEENRIFGVKPFRYLQELTGCIWNDKWTNGYTERFKADDENVDVVLTVKECDTIKTQAGVFDNCIKITLEAEIPNKSPVYYFEGYRYVWCGKKEFYYAKGVGIVRFDYTWGACLSSSSELVSYVNLIGEDSYMPLGLGSRWEYDEMFLTKEGYSAKRIIDVACGMNGKYLTHDIQEFLYLGTEEEYEDFKKKLM